MNQINDFAQNKSAHDEFYELDYNGICIKIIYRVAFGSLEMLKQDEKYIIMLYSDEIESKTFSTLSECLIFLKQNDIEFERLVPSNLGKMFARI